MVCLPKWEIYFAQRPMVPVSHHLSSKFNGLDLAKNMEEALEVSGSVSVSGIVYSSKAFTYITMVS